MVIAKLQNTFGDADGVSEHGVPAVVPIFLLFIFLKPVVPPVSGRAAPILIVKIGFQSRQFGCKTDTLTCRGKKNT